jgi:hypothetical protein
VHAGASDASVVARDKAARGAAFAAGDASAVRTAVVVVVHTAECALENAFGVAGSCTDSA